MQQPFQDQPHLGTITDKSQLKDKLGNRVCLVINTACVGDTINATPIIRTIRQKYPDFKLDVYTLYPDIFQYNKNVDSLFFYNQDLEIDGFYPIIRVEGYHKYFRVFPDLDKHDPSQFWHYTHHLIDFEAQTAFGDNIPDNEKWLEIPVSEKEKKTLLSKVKAKGINFEKAALIHPSITWPSRNWPLENWQALTNNLIDRGYQVIAVGKSSAPGSLREDDSDVDGVLGMMQCPKGAINLIDSLSILETIQLMEMSYCVFTVDTGLLHMALATDIYITAIFTVVHPKFRQTIRKGSFDHKYITVPPKGECTYCTLNKREEVQFAKYCLLSEVPECFPTPTEVLKSFGALIGKNRAKTH